MSTTKLAQALRSEGLVASADTVGRLLFSEGYSLQSTRKTMESGDHPDRDEQFQHIASQFRAGPVLERLDDLAVAMERSGGPAVLITHMGVLGGSRLVNYEVKRRQLLGTLFPVWGNRFSLDARERLLKGAPDGWPRHPSAILKWTGDERA